MSSSIYGSRYCIGIVTYRMLTIFTTFLVVIGCDKRQLEAPKSATKKYKTLNYYCKS